VLATASITSKGENESKVIVGGLISFTSNSEMKVQDFSGRGI
jgi:hypothetical protein